jgi:hypothetical protein
MHLRFECSKNLHGKQVPFSVEGNVTDHERMYVYISSSQLTQLIGVVEEVVLFHARIWAWITMVQLNDFVDSHGPSLCYIKYNTIKFLQS